jgi:hypothetical protein
MTVPDASDGSEFALPRAPVQEDAEVAEAEEPDAPMLPHVHAPHHGIVGWRDFCVSVTIIVVGLIIAVGLEQTVEYVHHEHQRAQLEKQMREVFEDNRHLIAGDIRQLNAFRAYLVEQQAALAAIHRGEATPKAPAATDQRIGGFLPIPGMGAFEASKANGTVALLSIDRIRIYNRVDLQYGLLRRDVDHYFEILAELRAFRKRFNPSPNGKIGISLAASAGGNAGLSAPELLEYQAGIGTALDAVDQVIVRLRRLDAQTRAVLRGARNESEVINAAINADSSSP